MLILHNYHCVLLHFLHNHLIYIVKENKKGKIEWLIEEKNKDNVNELVEINNTYFGTFEQDKGNNNYEFGFFKISEKTIKEQLTNKKVINITNESDVGKIVTKYVDKATNKEIAVSEEITDRVGVDYETKAKEIEYYKLEGTPENAKGKVTNGTKEVIYYYNKQDFNIKADKTISELYVNGEKQDVKNNKNNIFQVSINRKEVTKTDLKIRYIIRISNTGEIPGTAGKVTDQIPEGLEFHQEDLMQINKLAADTCYWPLYEVVNGKYKITYKPAKKLPIEEFLKPQKRFRHMFKPGNEWMIEDFQKIVDSRWEELLALEELTNKE